MFIKTSSTLAARNCSVPVPRVSRNWSTSQSANGLHGAGLPDYKRRLQGEDVAIEAVDHLLCRLARHTAVDYFGARGDGNFSLSPPRRGARARLNPAPPAATPRVEAPPSATMTTSRPPARALAVFNNGGSNA